MIFFEHAKIFNTNMFSNHRIICIELKIEIYHTSRNINLNIHTIIPWRWRILHHFRSEESGVFVGWSDAISNDLTPRW